MVSARPVFLEIVWLSRLDERVQEVTAVQGIGLEPFFPIGFSPRSGVHDHSKSAGHEVLDHELAHQWGQGYPVGLELRAHDDRAHLLGLAAGV